MTASTQPTDPVNWLLDQFYAPFAMAERANAKRKAGYQNHIAVRCWPQTQDALQDLLWEGQHPLKSSLQSSHVAFAVDCDAHAQRAAFLNWLSEQLAKSPSWSELCVWGLSPSSTQRSWLTAAVRILAPQSMRVQIPVKILGLRSTQICLNFGADSLAAPLSESRKLPIAGVASPHDISKLGLATLIEQAGLTPTFSVLQETSPA